MILKIIVAESENFESLKRQDRGCVMVFFEDEKEEVVSLEKVRKHPFLLRLRIRLAVRRLKKRMEKIKQVQEKLGIN